MQRNDVLIELLDALKLNPANPDAVTVQNDGYLRVLNNGDDDDILPLDAGETRLLQTPDAIRQFAKLFFHARLCAVELHHVTLDEELQSTLEENFSTVDEV